MVKGTSAKKVTKEKKGVAGEGTSKTGGQNEKRS